MIARCPEESEITKTPAHALGRDLIRSLALFASFQLRAFSAELIQWRIRRAADLVEILARPVFAVHTEMPECAASFFSVSGLRGHTNCCLPFKKHVLTPKIVRDRYLLVKYT